MFDFKWSRPEKLIARRAFDLALEREFASLTHEAKQRASRIHSRDDLWDLESWLTDRRKDIDRTYDFRYSVLPIVFARLLTKGFLMEDDLAGLGQEKIELIRRGSVLSI